MMNASCKIHLIVKIPFYFPAYLSPGGRGDDMVPFFTGKGGQSGFDVSYRHA